VPLTIAIDDAVIGRFPDLCVAAFACSQLGKARDAGVAGAAERLWAASRPDLEPDTATPNGILGLPEVAAWRAATAEQQLPPAKYRSSVEALVRRCLKGEGISQLQPVVAAYCAVSVRYMVPLVAYDLDRVPGGHIALRPLAPADRFLPIGYRPGQLPDDAPVVVYAAGSTVLSWAFNHRDSQETALKPYTSRAVFIGEVITAEGRAALLEAMQALRAVLIDSGVSAGPVELAEPGCPIVAVETL